MTKAKLAEKKILHPCAGVCSGWAQGYEDGLDDERSLRDTEVRELEEKLKLCKEALEYYANEKNWYPANRNESCLMVIAAKDTEGERWLGGRTARMALTKIGVRG